MQRSVTRHKEIEISLVKYAAGSPLVLLLESLRLVFTNAGPHRTAMVNL